VCGGLDGGETGRFEGGRGRSGSLESGVRGGEEERGVAEVDAGGGGVDPGDIGDGDIGCRDAEFFGATAKAGYDFTFHTQRIRRLGTAVGSNDRGTGSCGCHFGE